MCAQSEFWDFIHQQEAEMVSQIVNPVPSH
jgi:hypothetical protein